MTEPSQSILKEQHISSTKQKDLQQRNLNALKLWLTRTARQHDCPILTKTETVGQFLVIFSDTMYREYYFNCSRVVPCKRAGRTE